MSEVEESEKNDNVIYRLGFCHLDSLPSGWVGEGCSLDLHMSQLILFLGRVAHRVVYIWKYKCNRNGYNAVRFEEA